MKLSAFYSQIEAGGSLRRQHRATRPDNWYIGASMPFGQANFKQLRRTKADGTGIVGNTDATQWAIGADYNLSKRTALYATWASINNDDDSASSAFRRQAQRL